MHKGFAPTELMIFTIAHFLQKYRSYGAAHSFVFEILNIGSKI